MGKKLLLLIVFILYILLSFNPFEIVNTDENPVICVEIKGTVLNEGVYELPYDSTLNDLIELAVLKDNGDLSSFSLNQTLYNDEIIVIPEKESEETQIHKVSLNSASKEELMALEGIGENTAEKIIEYRNQYSFHNIEEIMNISGIGEKKFEKIKDHLTV